jgi:hypothetical protein
MRRSLTALMAVALLAALPASGAEAATKKKPCKAKNATTVAKNRYARVFEKPGRGADETGRLYGCVYKQNRRFLLDVASDDGYVLSESYTAVTLNRTRVAWEHESVDISCKADCPPGYDPESTDIRVVNLRTRKQKTYGGEVAGDALVVTRTGAIAWFQPGSPTSVRAVDADGARTLYAGDDIDGGSLSLRGSTVAWMAGGERMTATLR